MNAFRHCQELEAVSRDHLQKYLIRELVFEGRYVRIEKGPMAREFQITQGDYVWNADNVTAYRVEHKCEYSAKHGNFFLETFSNKSRGTLGWFYTNGADLLLYHFLRDGDVYLVRLAELRAWAYGHESLCGRCGKEGPRLHRYPERQQARYDQMNDTWGYCIRISDVLAGLTVRQRSVPPVYLDAYEALLDMERSVRPGNGQTELFDSP